ncbi:MAG: putative peptidoglycan glycosyltransferase FtsW [bacterium]
MIKPFTHAKHVNKVRKTIDSHNPDNKLLAIVSIMVIWGVIMVYSGSAVTAVRQDKPSYHYFLFQLFYIILGTICGYIAYRINYKLLPKIALYVLIISIFLLGIVILINLNSDIRRWIPIGPFTLQPSEVAKLAFAIYLASWLSKKTKIIANKTSEKFSFHLTHELIPFLILLSLVTIPIIIEPDLDTTIIIAVTAFITYFIAGNDLIHLLTSALMTFVLGITGFILTQMAKYRVDRVLTWLTFWRQGQQIQDPFGAGYQMRQILVAVASGGFFGLGFGESRQKFFYLGETAFTDTIYAIFAEEFGLIGSFILIFMFVYFLIRGLKIAKSAPNKFSMLLATSITIWISLQAFMHIAANVALLPINGNTLPFFSYGGSSMIVNLVAIGVLLNISRFSKLEGKLKRVTVNQ